MSLCEMDMRVNEAWEEISAVTIDFDGTDGIPQ
jgi:hypothetical protein